MMLACFNGRRSNFSTLAARSGSRRSGIAIDWGFTISAGGAAAAVAATSAIGTFAKTISEIDKRGRGGAWTLGACMTWNRPSFRTSSEE